MDRVTGTHVGPRTPAHSYSYISIATRTHTAHSHIHQHRHITGRIHSPHSANDVRLSITRAPQPCLRLRVARMKKFTPSAKVSTLAANRQWAATSRTASCKPIDTSSAHFDRRLGGDESVPPLHVDQHRVALDHCYLRGCSCGHVAGHQTQPQPLQPCHTRR